MRKFEPKLSHNARALGIHLLGLESNAPLGSRYFQCTIYVEQTISVRRSSNLHEVH